MSVKPAASRASRTYADLAVHHPGQADHVGAGARPGPAPSRRSARGWRRCRPRPRSSSTPQWPWSVNSSRHRSAITTSLVADGVHDCLDGDVEDAVRVVGARAPRVLVLRHTEEHQAADAGIDRLRASAYAGTPASAARRRAWTRSGPARLAPSRTKTGSTSSAGCSRVSATSRRTGADWRSRRGRTTGPGTPGRGATTWPCAATDALFALGRTHRLAGLRCRLRQAQPVVGERVDERLRRGLGREDVDPQAVLLGRLGGGRADAGDDRRGVRLAGDADEVAHRRGRGEDDRVELPALDRLADRRGRRGGPHRAVGGDVVDLPAHALQAGDEGLGGDVGARQEDPVDRVEQLVERRPVLEQPVRGLLAGGHEVGLEAPLAQRGGGDRRRRRRSSGRRRPGRRGRTPRTSPARP